MGAQRSPTKDPVRADARRRFWRLAELMGISCHDARLSIGLHGGAVRDSGV